MPKRVCFYEVLEVPYIATSDEIKKAFRRKALPWHPDKCRDLPDEEAKVRFQNLQEAYETLSDPQERAWYDGHRQEILRGGDTTGSKDEGPGQVNLWGYFSRGCFDNFDDDPKRGFFTVFSRIFQQVDEEDRKWSTSRVKRPTFGTSRFCWVDTNAFYKHWSDFSATAPFSHAAKYKIESEYSRDIRRTIEQENKKAINRAKREYNELVRKLVDWCHKRDPRVLERRQALARERVEQAQEAEALRLEQEAEYRRAALENRQRELERYEELEREKDELRMKGQVFLDDSDENAAQESEADSTLLVCKACRKKFKSSSQFKVHLQSKKHILQCKKLKIDPNDLVPPCEQSEGDASDGGDGDNEEMPSPIDVSRDDKVESPMKASEDESEESEESIPSKRIDVVNVDEDEDSDDSSSTIGNEPNIKVESSPPLPTAGRRVDPFELEMKECLDQAVLTQQKERESKAAKSLKPRKAKKEGGEGKSVTTWKCLVCSQAFPSRNQLMRHVEKENHAALRTEAVRKGGGKNKSRK